MSEPLAAPFFSVIIPTYNYAGYLDDAVKSVLRQEGDDFEIIIVDDGSTDRTPEAAKAVVDEHPCTVRYLRQDNAGPGAARNHGVREAKGAFCLFLDADDRLLDGALATFHRVVSVYPEAGMVLAGHQTLHPDGRRREHPQPPLSSDRRHNFVAYLRSRFGISNGASVIARQVFARFGFPEDIRNGEDVAIFAKILALYDCVSVPVAVLEVRKHDDSLRNRIDWILHSGDRVVEHLFDPSSLPHWALIYRREFHARQLLSLFRSCYLAGRYVEARCYYHAAIRSTPRLLFNFSALRKYLRMLWRRL